MTCVVFWEIGGAEMRGIAQVWAALAIAALASTTAWAADEPGHRPVSAVADTRLTVAPGATFPLYVSRDWSKPQPDINRAVLVLHGVLRNADVYYRTALAAQAAAGDAGRTSLMIAPQFLAGIDIAPNHLPADTLHWKTVGWEAGDNAEGPAPISSFAALDAILARLADRSLFPHLTQVVVAGHSGGGQVVQRYAIAGQGEVALTRAGVAVRYVVANPSSYAYFSAERPEPVGNCTGFNDWEYGMEHLPAYLAGASAAALEQRYVARRVIYLLGTADTNPNHPALDRSCMAEAQGPFRYARGKAYVGAMRARDGGTPHHVQWDVAGVGHDGDRMFTSACGLTALFDLPGC
jgi:pimeloyl-ACP methyl ester carboxylesterase